MADINQPIMSVVSTSISELNNLPVENGQLVFVKDKKLIALDLNGKRTIYDKIEVLKTDDERTNLLAPINELFYFVLSTSVLWTYNNKWIQITTPPNEIVFIGTSFPDVGSSKTLYIDKTKKNISTWNESTKKYEVVAGLEELETHNASSTSHNDIRNRIYEMESRKVDTYHGVWNENKILKVGSNGYVELGELPIVQVTDNNAGKVTVDIPYTSVSDDGLGKVTISNVSSVANNRNADRGIERIEELVPDKVVELESNKLYVFPEIDNFTYTLIPPINKNVINKYNFIFESGTTPTKITHPNEVKIGNFHVEENKIYEITIIENLLKYESWDK